MKRKKKTKPMTMIFPFRVAYDKKGNYFWQEFINGKWVKPPPPEAEGKG